MGGKINSYFCISPKVYLCVRHSAVILKILFIEKSGYNLGILDDRIGSDAR